MPAAFASVVALKPLVRAKSRFIDVPAPLRERLVLYMALDTVAALQPLGPIVVVTDQPGFGSWCRRLCSSDGIRVVPDGCPDLASAMRHGVHEAAADRVLVSVADLPALRSEEAAAVAAQDGFLADTDGVGTTMVSGRAADISLCFGADSAAAHGAAGLVALPGDWPTARRDVDAAENLRRAADLGVGPWTRHLVDDAGELWQYRPVTVAGDITRDGGGSVVDDGGVRHPVEPDCLAVDLVRARGGQRLHAALSGAAIQHLWL